MGAFSKALLGLKPEKQNTLQFREDFTFTRDVLPVADSCIQLKKEDIVVKAWGHSPRAALPMKGQRGLVQMVCDRDGNPLDPFNKVNKRELFTEATIHEMAIEQEAKAAHKHIGQQVTKAMWMVLFIDLAVWMTVSVTFFSNHFNSRIFTGGR